MEHKEVMALLVKEKSTIEGIIRLNATAGSDVEAIAMQELDFLGMHMIAKPFIAECMPETIIQAVKYSLKNNLSLDPNAGLVYLMPTSVKINGVYKQALEVKPTAEGKLSIAYQCGTILDNKRPVVEKDGNGKVKSASVEILLPSIPNPRWEKVELDQSDFDRLRKFSHQKNGKNKQDADAVKMNYANALYTSFNGGIDPEFARSKVVSAALKKRGTNQAARLSNRIIVQENKEVIVEQSTEKKDVEFAVYEEIITPKAETVSQQTAEVPVTTEVKSEPVAQINAIKLPDPKDL